MSEVKTTQTFEQWNESDPPVVLGIGERSAAENSRRKGWNAALAAVVQTGRFEVGDDVEAFDHKKQEWVKATIGAHEDEIELWTYPEDVRPLPQTVDLTVEEKVGRLVFIMPNPTDRNERDLLLALATGKTIDELCAEYNIPTTREVK